MKTYILRDLKPVEPQKSMRPPRPKPAAPATGTGPVLCIGLDVHNDSIAVSRARLVGVFEIEVIERAVRHERPGQGSLARLARAKQRDHTAAF